ncbi:hypothetical protein [Capnocytophaga canis]|uniref:Restriction endonuclease domain-containing protein n=1 Tax=Capnocytophaga canis TaxID=1848903 RepID=A0A0B7IJ05_9FLAO|nr:hypothetical protein [Capnocytophaga canis]CEN51861.1 conserved hypothetical protein [Capnocytophaga canis]
MEIEGKSRTFQGQDFYELYQEGGVQEYWVVHPTEKAIFEGEVFTSVIFPNLEVDADIVFEI